MLNSGDIVVDGLSKVFKKGSTDEVRAVDGVSFEIKKGELFGLLVQTARVRRRSSSVFQRSLSLTEGRPELAGSILTASRCG